MRGLGRRSLSACLVLGVVASVLTATAVLALHRETPGATRITRTVTHKHSPGRSWGNYLAFTSNQDLAFNGNSTQHILVFNSFQYVCQRGQPEPATAAKCPNPPVPFIQQVTNRPGEPDNPSITLLHGVCAKTEQQVCEDDSECVLLSGDNVGPCANMNQWVAFDALGTFNGGTGAAASHRQIFMRNLRTQEILQVTNGTDGDSVRPSVASLGGLIVFQSTATLGGVPNPSGAWQIYAYEKDTNLLKQITFGQASSTQPMPNQNGQLISFQSTANLVGDGSDTGISQIFWADYDRHAHAATIKRLTNGDGPSQNPFIAESDQLIAFETTATNLGGIPGGSKIYLSSNVKKDPVTIRQITW